MKEILERLSKLEECAENAIELAKKNKRKEWILNLDDLSAYAQYTLDKDGDERYMVTISEASPDNEDFCHFVKTYLDGRYFHNVEVYTEW